MIEDDQFDGEKEPQEDSEPVQAVPQSEEPSRIGQQMLARLREASKNPES